jgi:membrane glycosyltransferase
MMTEPVVPQPMQSPGEPVQADFDYTDPYSGLPMGLDLPAASSLSDAAGAWLPPEDRLAVPVQDFASSDGFRPMVPVAGSWVPRASLLFGGLVLTIAFGYELYRVLAFPHITPIQIVFLILSNIAFSWIAFGSLSAAMGFLPLFAGEKPEIKPLPALRDAQLKSRVALLFPVYHEDPARIAAAIEAMAEDLQRLQVGGQFDVFILSDTRGETAGGPEAQAYRMLAEKLAGTVSVSYRRRLENTAKKAGNIKDWVERFGAGYATFIILDADSIMTGETMVRLAAAMDARPDTGLIQTVPRLAGGRTLFQKLQQFAAGVYGPAVSAGLAVWHRHQGNYWGHNAIIRTAAFAQAAGLPALPGRLPFGGNILSHDFVEAVLLQRAGWQVHMAPTELGSYEGAPPGLIDLAIRDRRWAQGNLQHLAIVTAPGLTVMGRIHLAMGVCAYVISAIWALSLIAGLVLALQGQQLVPSYFYQDSKSLIPVWPVIDPGAAFRLFLATMAVVLLPKALGMLLEIRRAKAAGETFAWARTPVSVIVETLFSMLFAPILMVTQTTAVAQIFAGLDSGWKAQRRDEGRVTWIEVFQFHRWHALLGLVAAAICYLVSFSLMAWMGPVLLGLILSVGLTWYTARPASNLMSWLLATPEDRNPPAILRRVDALAVEWDQRLHAR